MRALQCNARRCSPQQRRNLRRILIDDKMAAAHDGDETIGAAHVIRGQFCRVAPDGRVVDAPHIQRWYRDRRRLRDLQGARTTAKLKLSTQTVQVSIVFIATCHWRHP